MAASLFFELQICSFVTSICNNMFQVKITVFGTGLIYICVQHDKTHPIVAPNEMILFFISHKHINNASDYT